MGRRKEGDKVECLTGETASDFHWLEGEVSLGKCLEKRLKIISTHKKMC
jgi:hypothetical protein